MTKLFSAPLRDLRGAEYGIFCAGRVWRLVWLHSKFGEQEAAGVAGWDVGHLTGTGLVAFPKLTRKEAVGTRESGCGGAYLRFSTPGV